ncbi:hypothetical protein N2152v2_006294 [Parachlorella kessleri]
MRPWVYMLLGVVGQLAVPALRRNPRASSTAELHLSAPVGTPTALLAEGSEGTGEKNRARPSLAVHEVAAAQPAAAPAPPARKLGARPAAARAAGTAAVAPPSASTTDATQLGSSAESFAQRDASLPPQSEVEEAVEEAEDPAARELEVLQRQLLQRTEALWAGPPSEEKLFARIEADLAPFAERGNITERMVDHAYCNSIRQGFRFQVVGGRLYAVGTSESFETRLLNVQRQLWAVAQRWQLPDLDVMIEQSDWPTIGPLTEGCSERGPVIAPAKHSLDPNHTHVLLAPDHTFGEWVEARTPSWAEMQALLAASARDHTWEGRAPILLFRGAPMGPTRAALADSMHHWAAAHNWHLDIKIREGIHSPQEFKSMFQHCAHKYLLHLEGNSYSGRLKYLLSCGAAVVWLGARDTNLTSAYHEFYYHLLNADEHLLHIETGENKTTGEQNNMAAQLAAALKGLLANDTKARSMGHAAQHAARALLTPDHVQRYWYRLLTRYAQLQGFQPRLHPDAVPLEEAMVSRRWIPHDRRTCPRGCRSFPPGPLPLT